MLHFKRCGGVAGALAGVLLLATGPAGAENSPWRDRFDISAVASGELALETVDGGAQKGQLSLTPELTAELAPALRLTAVARARFDGPDELEPGRPDQPERDALSRRALPGDRAELELRELYLDAFAGEVFLRLGKQQVVWGQADGLKVLDLVNPQSFREFILEDFEDSRIPLWTVLAELPLGAGLVQALWIPDQTYDEMPDPDAAYAFTSPRVVPRPPPGVPVVLEDPDRPNALLADSDAGLRYSVFAGGWDLTLNYLYHYHDRAVFRRRQGPAGVTLTPEYRRTHTAGGTASSALGDFTLRAELAYSSERHFLTADRRDRDGLVASSELGYVAGVDWHGLTDTLVSGQLFQSVLADSPPGLIRDRIDTRATLLLERRFMRETLTAELLWIHGFNDGDGVVRPEVRYALRGNFTLQLGADIFYGATEGLFGQFATADRLTLGFEWGI